MSYPSIPKIGLLRRILAASLAACLIFESAGPAVRIVWAQPTPTPVQVQGATGGGVGVAGSVVPGQGGSQVQTHGSGQATVESSLRDLDAPDAAGDVAGAETGSQADNRALSISADGQASPQAPQALAVFSDDPQPLRDAVREAGQVAAEQFLEISPEKAAAQTSLDFIRAETPTQDLIAQAPLETARTRSSTLFEAFRAARQEARVAAVQDHKAFRRQQQVLTHPKAQAPAQPEQTPYYGTDSHGGPNKLSLSIPGQIWYGVKWAFNMVGIQALVNALALAVAFAFGAIGPGGGERPVADIFGGALAYHPWSFLWELRKQMYIEEIDYRILYFGGAFALLAALRPLTQQLLERTRNLNWVRTLGASFVAGTAVAAAGLGTAFVIGVSLPVSWTVGLGAVAAAFLVASLLKPDLPERFFTRIGSISSVAFPLAAWGAAVFFTASHFGLWGVSFAGILQRTMFAYFMAYVLYRSRNLFAPIAAHYLYNSLLFLAPILALHFGNPSGAKLYGILLQLGAAAFLWYQMRRWDQARGLGKWHGILSLVRFVGGLALIAAMGPLQFVPALAFLQLPLAVAALGTWAYFILRGAFKPIERSPGGWGTLRYSAVLGSRALRILAGSLLALASVPLAMLALQWAPLTALLAGLALPPVSAVVIALALAALGTWALVLLVKQAREWRLSWKAFKQT